MSLSCSRAVYARVRICPADLFEQTPSQGQRVKVRATSESFQVQFTQTIVSPCTTSFSVLAEAVFGICSAKLSSFASVHSVDCQINLNSSSLYSPSPGSSSRRKQMTITISSCHPKSFLHVSRAPISHQILPVLPSDSCSPSRT